MPLVTHGPRCAIGCSGPGVPGGGTACASTSGGAIAPAGAPLSSATAKLLSATRFRVGSPIQHPGEQADEIRHHRDQRCVDTGRGEADQSAHGQRVGLGSGDGRIQRDDDPHQQPGPRARPASTRPRRNGRCAVNVTRRTTAADTTGSAARPCTAPSPTPGPAASHRRRPRPPRTTPTARRPRADEREPSP